MSLSSAIDPGEPLSGVILAGGASRRMGRDKALLDFDGQPLIARIAGRLAGLCAEVIIAAGACGRFAGLADRCVEDVYPGVGTLGGLHAGLLAARRNAVAVVACDMPFVDPRVLARMAALAPTADLVILRHEGHVEPLHAIYRKSCLSVIEATILSGERCAYAFHDRLVVRYVDAAELADLDPQLRSFRNVNTVAEWEATRRETR